MSWSNMPSTLSPKEEREWWIAELKRREPYGMAVNCRHTPSLEKTPALRRLIKEGKIVRVRENRQWGKSYRRSTGKRTVLRIAQ